MTLFKKTIAEFDLLEHQITFIGSSVIRFSFALPSIAYPGKTNLMLDSVSANKCFNIIRIPEFKVYTSNLKVWKKPETSNFFRTAGITAFHEPIRIQSPRIMSVQYCEGCLVLQGTEQPPQY